MTWWPADKFGPNGPDWLGTGYWYLGPVSIPPLVPVVGMTDRTTTTVYFLYWNGTSGLSLETTRSPASQNYYTFQPWDGPFISGLRLGVNNGALVLDNKMGKHGRQQTHPIFVPSYTQPLAQTYPEPTNYPAPGVPTIPGIPSSTPPPTGGGYAAFEKAYTTNTPPLLIAQFSPTTGLFYLTLYASGGPYNIAVTNLS